MSHIFGCLITTAYLCPQKETPPDTHGKTRTVFKMITNPKTPFCMTNDYPNPIPDPTTVPQTSTLTYEQRLVIEDQLVEVFSEVIDLDDSNGTASPVWRGSVSQLMEISWTLSRMHRIIDHDTRRPMTMYRIATLLCRNLHRRFGPIVISSGFRSAAVNRLVPGAVPASQHTKGEAADIVIGTAERGIAMYRYIRENIDFDQLIWEPIGAAAPRWLHVSYTRRRKNRHCVL